MKDFEKKRKGKKGQKRRPNKKHEHFEFTVRSPEEKWGMVGDSLLDRWDSDYPEKRKLLSSEEYDAFKASGILDDYEYMASFTNAMWEWLLPSEMGATYREIFRLANKNKLSEEKDPE